MAIIEDIEESASSHPAYWIGGVFALLGLVYLYFRSGSSSGSVANFTYSIGPTDAQIAAGTAQQNQLQADQTAVSLANIQATSQNTIANDYFGYLTQNSANALQAQNINDQLAGNENATNTAAAVTINQSNNNVAMQDLADSYALANTQAGYSYQVADNTLLTQQNINANNNATYLQAGSNAGALATANAQAAANAAAATAANNQVSSLQSQLNSANATNSSNASLIAQLKAAISNIGAGLGIGQGYQADYNAGSAAYDAAVNAGL